VKRGAAEQRDAADEGRLEASGSILVGTVIVSQGRVVRPSQLIASVRPTPGGGMRLGLPAVLSAVLLASPMEAAPRVPFSGWLKAELVSDSVWFHCELSIFVDEARRGSQRVSCKSDEGKPTLQVEERLSTLEIAQLRKLLRDADLFQGQFWGTDLRGLDAGLITLAVNDESKAAVVVCFKNESFDTGPRRELFDWLTRRMNAKRQGGVSK
jgi:hypothetical protein